MSAEKAKVSASAAGAGVSWVPVIVLLDVSGHVDLCLLSSRACVVGGGDTSKK